MAFKPLNKLFRPWLSACDQSIGNYSVNSFYKCLDATASDYRCNSSMPYMNYCHSMLASKQCFDCLSDCVNLNTNHTNVNIFAKQRSRVLSPIRQTIAECSSVPNTVTTGVTANRSGSQMSGYDRNCINFHNNDNNVNKIWLSRIKRQRPKRFHCPHCHIAFSNNGQLKGHIRTHTGERPFVCDQRECGKSFTRNEELTRHRRIHTGVRPYCCNVCTKRFGRKDHLKKHQRTHEKRFYSLPSNGLSVDPTAPLQPSSLPRSSSQSISAFYNSMYLQIRHHF